MSFDQNKPANSAPLSSSDMRNNFQHLKSAISKEHNWNDAEPDGTTHKLNAISAVVTGSTQRRDPLEGAADYTNGSGELVAFYNHIEPGVTAGTYTLQSLLQALVNKSHTHTRERRFYNCNCDA